MFLIVSWVFLFVKQRLALRHLIIVAISGVQYYTLQSQNVTSSTTSIGDTCHMHIISKCYRESKLTGLVNVTNLAEKQWGCPQFWRSSPVSACVMQRNARTFVSCWYPVAFTLCWQSLVASNDSETCNFKMTNTLFVLMVEKCETYFIQSHWHSEE